MHRYWCYFYEEEKKKKSHLLLYTRIFEWQEKILRIWMWQSYLKISIIQIMNV